MPTPVTTTEVLLQQAVDLLTEVRDLLRPPSGSSAVDASSPAPKASKKTAAKKAAPQPSKE